MERSPLIAAGAVNGALAVAAGAFAAHGLRDHVDARSLEVFDTGARYHMVHAVAMILAGLLAARWPAVARAGWIFQLGILLFAGSLYALGATDRELPWLGAITPFGGVAFIVGWVWIAVSALRRE
jgi:uncharacterized membrane protein YgdD (TMEM256/DUF423 family)|nr:DUF423 domain-containing protein [Kofleriaceae bacterium]